MRHPRRRRILALVVAGLGVVSVLIALGLTAPDGVGSLKVILGALGATMAIVGAMLALVYHLREARRYDRLRRGDGVLVRWRIDGARWRAFQEMAATLAHAPGALPNELAVPATIPAEGVEVLVSGDAFLVGPDFELVEKNAVARLSGPVLEIEQRVPVNRYQTRRVVYRLPAAAGAEADVARLAQHFAAQAARSSNRVQKMALVALGLCIIVLVALVVWVMTVAR
ncbi:MAG TPA: hypothetical protein VHN79_10235 [Lacunisphaera sp.]|nr:hypothetical protein [Lacunisphaera sp.]